MTGLLLIRDLLLALQEPVKLQLEGEYAKGGDGGTYEGYEASPGPYDDQENDELREGDDGLAPGTPSCGPGRSTVGCFKFLLTLIEGIPNPINLTVANWGNFTDEGPTIGKAKVHDKAEL